MAFLTWQALNAYTAIATIDTAANAQTAPPVLLFGTLTTSGIDVPPTVPAVSRGAYRDALERFVLTATGACLSLVLLLIGLVILLNL
jgi:hypothetical protein